MKNSAPSARRRILLAMPAVLTAAAIGTVLSLHSSRPASAAPAKAEQAPRSPLRFTEDGELLRPEGYRKWTYVGTPLTPNDMNGGKAPFPEFHTVYINPDAYSQYEQTGEFPDGTVLVKELISVGTKEASSGNGYFTSSEWNSHKAMNPTTVIITGASSGIGLAVAEAFVRDGTNVVLNGRTEDKLVRAAALIGRPDRVALAVGDITRPKRLTRSSMQRYGVSDESTYS